MLQGRFVGSLLHPVFFTPRVSRSMEIRDDHEVLRREVKHTMTLTGYLNVPPWKGWAERNQPALQVRKRHIVLLLPPLPLLITLSRTPAAYSDP